MEKGQGVLLPVSALYSEYGIGSLGNEAKNFIDILKTSGYNYWQILPLTPTGYGDSPYQSCSAFALNPYFLSLDILAQKGLLSKSELKRAAIKEDRIDYGALFLTRYPLLKLAFSRFDRNGADFLKFKNENPYLIEFALYMAAKEKNQNLPWYEWDKAYKFPTKEFFEDFKAQNEKEIDFWLFTQYEFTLEWNELKAYANKNSVKIIGDLPIYVAYDSVEMWLHSEMFLTDSKKRPTLVAGVPPDYFCADGQLWGNPVYNYSEMKKDGYKWWKERIAYALKNCDYVRVDHFRGMDRFYAIPFGSQNAKIGVWKKVPGFEIFKNFKEGIIAEDLGVLDDGVYKLLKKTGYPGMKVLSFAFDYNPDNPYKPSKYDPFCVAYTGTHDNEPLLSYIESRLKSDKEQFLADVNSELKKGKLKVFKISEEVRAKDVAKRLIKLLKNSRADVKIFPVQDLLLLDSDSRINAPAILSSDNWSWKLKKGQINKLLKR